ncbi:CD209 antigen-like [Suncus etruscus]|uniref:CD209 antigen-like n=1 Tax=Suncus etruscus TaxID=109475 RepID=UPI002110AA83|nr:CD209 antigen-like [Suncus etruscus]
MAEMFTPKGPGDPEQETFGDMDMIENKAGLFQNLRKRWSGHLPRIRLGHLQVFISLSFFLGLIIVLVQVVDSRNQIQDDLIKIRQQMAQLNVTLERLCWPCPLGWESFQGNCYWFSRSQSNWFYASKACERLKAKLVIVNSKEEEEFLQLWEIRHDKKTWIGLTDHHNESSWEWVDKTPLRDSYWKRGEPNDINNEDCAELLDDGWNDIPCTSEIAWIWHLPKVSLSLLQLLISLFLFLGMIIVLIQGLSAYSWCLIIVFLSEVGDSWEQMQDNLNKISQLLAHLNVTMYHHKEGSWEWVDKTPLNDSYWKPGEPNDDLGNEDSVELLDDGLNDIPWPTNSCRAVFGGNQKSLSTVGNFQEQMKDNLNLFSQVLAQSNVTLEKFYGNLSLAEKEVEQPQTVRKWSERCPRLSLSLLQLLVSLILFILLVNILVQTETSQKPDLVNIDWIHHQQTPTNVTLGVFCHPCPWIWTEFQGSCYLLFRSKSNWNDALSACQHVNALLVVINSEAEEKFLQSWKVRDKKHTWIGLSDHLHEGSWRWVDDTPLQLSFWRAEGSNSTYDENCVELYDDGWNNNLCSALRMWICEKPSTLCPKH